MPRYDTLDDREYTSETDPVLAAQIRLRNKDCSCNWKTVLIIIVALLLLLSVAGGLVYLFVFAGESEGFSSSNQTPITTAQSATLETTAETTQSTPLATQKPFIDVGQKLYSTCDEYLQNGFTQPGIYRLQNGSQYDFQAYCTMDTKNQTAWMILQKRTSNIVPFHNQTFVDYSQGFGNVDQDHWLGLAKVRKLIEAGNKLQLRVEIEGDRCDKDQNDFHYVGTWDFEIESERNNFTLHVSDLLDGNFTDPVTGINKSNGLQFHAIRGSKINKSNCLDRHHMGGWWIQKDGCTLISLNGEYTCERPNTMYGFWVHYKHPDNKDKEVVKTSYIRPRASQMLIHVL